MIRCLRSYYKEQWMVDLVNHERTTSRNVLPVGVVIAAHRGPRTTEVDGQPSQRMNQSEYPQHALASRVLVRCASAYYSLLDSLARRNRTKLAKTCPSKDAHTWLTFQEAPLHYYLFGSIGLVFFSLPLQFYTNTCYADT